MKNFFNKLFCLIAAVSICTLNEQNWPTKALIILGSLIIIYKLNK